MKCRDETSTGSILERMNHRQANSAYKSYERNGNGDNTERAGYSGDFVSQYTNPSPPGTRNSRR